MQTKNKAKQSRFSQKEYWTPSMFEAFVHNRLGPFLIWRDQVDPVQRGCLTGKARVRSMLQKGVKRHLSSQGRKQYRQPFYSRDPPRISSQRKVSDQKSLMKINSPRRISCVFWSTLVGPTLIICIIIM